MKAPLRLGIVGCGDFLRLQEKAIRESRHIEVAAFYNPTRARSEKFAAKWPGSRVAASAEELLDAPDVDMIALFVPPGVRRPLFVRAAQRGKRIITTKPLASTIEDGEEMQRAVEQTGIAAGVIYGRTGSGKVVTLKRLLDSGRFGRLALFKQDWLHHYPQWNTWALDPAKNGGPFMDAMIHNLNIARYLVDRPAIRGTLFSEKLSHPGLPCADTEFLKLDFAGNSSAHLFITWAADLRVDDLSGNYREHVDIWYAITDQGWRISDQVIDGQPRLAFTREGKVETFPLDAISQTPYDALATGQPDAAGCYGHLASVAEALEDIRIIRLTGAQPGVLTQLA